MQAVTTEPSPAAIGGQASTDLAKAKPVNYSSSKTIGTARPVSISCLFSQQRLGQLFAVVGATRISRVEGRNENRDPLVRPLMSTADERLRCAARLLATG